jgi:hypothetical protein
MESTEEHGNPHKRVIYMLLFPSCYLQMEPSEEMSCLGWNPLKSWTTSDGPLCSHLHAVVSIRLPPDGVYRGDEPPWM